MSPQLYPPPSPKLMQWKLGLSPSTSSSISPSPPLPSINSWASLSSSKPLSSSSLASITPSGLISGNSSRFLSLILSPRLDPASEIKLKPGSASLLARTDFRELRKTFWVSMSASTFRLWIQAAALRSQVAALNVEAKRLNAQVKRLNALTNKLSPRVKRLNYLGKD